MLVSMLGVLLVVSSVSAATTISTSISTGGTLTVTGLSSLGFASTTVLTTTGNLVVNGFATTTASNGNIATAGTLSVTGLSTLGYASTTGVSMTGNFIVNGLATTTASSGAIATQGSLTVGPTGRAVNDLVYGYCSISDSATIAASSTKYFTCTTDSTGNLTATHRIFVQATSSLPFSLVVRAASSTAANTIQLEISNLAINTNVATAPGAISLNYFGIK